VILISDSDDDDGGGGAAAEAARAPQLTNNEPTEGGDDTPPSSSGAAESSGAGAWLHESTHGANSRHERSSERREVPRCKSRESKCVVWHGGDRKGSLNDGQVSNFCVVRVHVSTGYNRVEGNRRASRNGRVSDLPPEIPYVTIRNFCVAVGGGRGAAGGRNREDGRGQGRATEQSM
jgi:hypothetical protein